MPTVSYETITYEVDGHTATITLNRPDALNALSPFMITELRAAYDDAENDDAVWLLIVTGTGRAFCTGADVKEIPEDGKVINERAYLSSYDQWEAPQEGTPPFRRMAKPVIVAVNGICCGAGLDWVTTGDIVIASDQATFFDPHVSIGLVAGREMVRLARVLPRSVALRMAILGKHERMSAERAYELGLITAPDPDLAARMLLGPIMTYVAIDGFLQTEAVTPPTAAKLERIVDYFLAMVERRP